MRDCVTIMHAGTDPLSIPDQHALITKEWKLVYHAGDRNGELYHLSEDPHELNNLYNIPEFESTQRLLTLRLLDEIIRKMDREALMLHSSAGRYGNHRMSYEVWKEEFNQLAQLTGKV